LTKENFYNESYFEAGRSAKIRSIQKVCEEFSNKPDAKRALLEEFLLEDYEVHTKAYTVYKLIV
jgi:hypothetical protein